MVNASVVQNILSIIGNVITLSLFFSPLPDVYKLIITNSVEDFKLCAPLANLLSSMLWLFYKMLFIHPYHILGITVDVTGFLLQLVYLAIFFNFAHNKPRKKLGIYVVMELISMAIIVAITMVVLPETKNRSLMMGIICNGYNTLMNIKPITMVMEVMRTKSVKHMSLPVSLASFVNACVWTAYAILKHDIYMLINKGVGVISDLLQLITYGYYCVNWSKT